jgi:antitoxin component YwqK of YwqJK toxin-antitoxin module
MENYRSSIPKTAQERIVATYVTGPQKYKAEYILNGEVVGVRYFEENGNLMSETPIKNGLTHGIQYLFDEGCLEFSETYQNGLAHGTAKQWSPDGELIGTYTMKHGTGLDLWRCKNNWGNGSIYLSEARYFKDGHFQGFEWWINEDQKTVNHERHFCQDQVHGIERFWNAEGRLRRGYPKYWVNNKQVTKRAYIKECANDMSLPRFNEEDNLPQRKFPDEVAIHCK